MKFEMRDGTVVEKKTGTLVGMMASSNVWIQPQPLWLTGDELIDLGKFLNKQKRN
jgi:hypothetical protein